MAEVTWFKVLTDIFSDDKIKILQSMPEGDSLLVMWFKVLSQAGKTNDGGYIYLKSNIPYTAGMLATLFGKPQQIVELALRTFTEFGMIDIDDRGYIFVMNWEKHQSIDKLNKIKEQTKLRVKNHREKKKQELLESNATVTLPKRTINAIDIDKEKELKDIGDSEECANTFQTFWSAYPKKNGKTDALKKWTSYHKKGEISIEVVMDGLNRYMNYIDHERLRGFDRQYMDGKTFVNQKQWESEWKLFGVSEPKKIAIVPDKPKQKNYEPTQEEMELLSIAYRPTSP